MVKQRWGTSLPWRRPRQQLLFCAFLDFAGLPIAAATTKLVHSQAQFQAHPEWMLLLGLMYLLMGWLLGSYTVLRWPGLRLRVLFQRLALTAISSAFVLVLLGWLFNAPREIILLERSNLFLLMSCLTIWSFAVRCLLRWLGVAPGSADPLAVMVSSNKAPIISREWLRSPYTRKPNVISPGSFFEDNHGSHSFRQLTLGPGLKLEPNQKIQLKILQKSGITINSFEHVVGYQLERLPPALLPEDWLCYTDLPWSNEFSFQRKLKRISDFSVALILLILSAPIIFIAGVLIYLEDPGPVFYVQERSGWMGRPFRLFKLRTMDNLSSHRSSSWTVPGDRRITRIGKLLRPMRLDELPQLLNVLLGEMSLIGPRPELPDIEKALEESISHYRKRHWMLPGLSGWAQVCAPYASSIDEAELKLSYDLYYLKYWSTGLDLLILAKTIKTILKGAGR